MKEIIMVNKQIGKERKNCHAFMMKNSLISINEKEMGNSRRSKGKEWVDEIILERKSMAKINSSFKQGLCFLGW